MFGQQVGDPLLDQCLCAGLGGIGDGAECGRREEELDGGDGVGGGQGCAHNNQPSGSSFAYDTASRTQATEPGLLAKANRGISYVDEANLPDDHLVDVLLGHIGDQALF